MVSPFSLQFTRCFNVTVCKNLVKIFSGNSNYSIFLGGLIMDSKGTSTQKLAMAGVLTGCCSSRQSHQHSHCGKQMCSCTAYGQCICSCSSWSLVGIWHRFLCQPDPQCSGDWQFSRFSRKYDRCTLLWSYVSFHRQTFSYLRC